MANSDTTLSGEHALASAPRAARPDMPDYGISADADGLLPWQHVSEQMAADAQLLDWHGSARWPAAYDTGVGRVGGRDFLLRHGAALGQGANLAANPALVVHLESGDDVVVLEGVAESISALDPVLFERIADQYAAKYNGFRPEPPSAETPFVALQCRVAFGWQETDFVRSATRWTFR